MTGDGEHSYRRSPILQRYNDWRRMGKMVEEAIPLTARGLQVPEQWVTALVFAEITRPLETAER